MDSLEAFEASLKGDVVLPSSPDYSSAIRRWAVNTERHASLVVFPKDSADVVLALSFAEAQNYQIAIRGGGHNLAGSSSVEGGLVIDLSRYIDHVRIDEKEKLGYVGGGAIWEQVDKEAIKYGLAAVAGTVNNTGVGGFTLGGGYGFLTSSYGLAIDNLVQVTIVTASGSILTASSTSNQDLFWAIRGGGCNFGVVTEFVFKLHPQRASVYFGMLMYSIDKAEEVVDVTRKWWETAGEKESMMQIAGLGPNGQPVIIIVPFYNGSEEEGRTNFKAFLDVGPIVDKTSEIPYEGVNDFLNFVAKPGAGVYTKGVSLTLATAPYTVFSAALARALAISEAPKDVYGGIQAKIMFDYHPPAKLQSVPSETTAFSRTSLDDSNDKAYSAVLHLSWPGETDAEKVMFEGEERTKTEVARELARELGDIFTDGKMDGNKSYTNYDGDANYTRKGEGSVYEKTKLKFGDNYARMQKVKKLYDPSNIFNRWFPVQPEV